jgi:hypothetical protein
MQASAHCRNVVGPSIRGGSEALIDRRSLHWAETVKRLLEAVVRTLNAMASTVAWSSRVVECQR